MSGNENLKTGQNQVIINVTAVNGISTKRYYINAYKRNEEEEISYNEEQQNNINAANEVIEQMSRDAMIENEDDVTNNENMDEENNEMIDKVFMICGIILSTIVIGIVIIRIKKLTKSLKNRIT